MAEDLSMCDLCPATEKRGCPTETLGSRSPWAGARRADRHSPPRAMTTADALTPCIRSLRQEREADADHDALQKTDRDRSDGRGDRDHEVELTDPPELSQGAHLDQAKNGPDHDRRKGGRGEVLERLRDEQQDGKHPERGGHAREVRAPADHLDHGRARGARTGRDPRGRPRSKVRGTEPDEVAVRVDLVPVRRATRTLGAKRPPRTRASVPSV